MKTCTNCGHELLMSYNYDTGKKTGLKCPIMNCKEFKAHNSSLNSELALKGEHIEQGKDTENAGDNHSPESDNYKGGEKPPLSGTNATDNTGCAKVRGITIADVRKGIRKEIFREIRDWANEESK